MKKIILLNYQIAALMFGTGCTTCTVPPPPPNPTCTDYKPTTSAGIVGVIGVKCDYAFADETDSAEWLTAIAAGNVISRVAPEHIKGALPKGAPIKMKLGAVGKETTIGYNHKLTLMDNLADVTAAEHQFYDYVAQYGQSFIWRAIHTDETYTLMGKVKFDRSFQGGDNEDEVCSIESNFEYRKSAVDSTRPKAFAFPLSLLQIVL